MRLDVLDVIENEDGTLSLELDYEIGRASCRERV